MKSPVAAQLVSLLFASWLCLASGCVKSTDGSPSTQVAGADPSSPAQATASPAVAAKASPKRTVEPPSRGPANAPISIETYSDFECPYCAQGALLLRKLEQLYPGKIRVIWRNFPLEFHERALPAASAALAAYEEGGNVAFWKMHDLLFVGHFTAGGPRLADADFIAFSQKLGLDPQRIVSAAKTGRFRQAVGADLARGRALGITGTPSFVVNGHLIEGIVPLAAFRHAIDALLRQRQERLRHAI